MPIPWATPPWTWEDTSSGERVHLSGGAAPPPPRVAPRALPGSPKLNSGDATLGEPLLVAPAERIVRIGAERWNPPEAPPLVKPDRLLLVNPRLQPQQVDAVGLGVGGQVIQDPLREPRSAKLGPNVHPLQLAVLAIHQLDAAATRGRTLLRPDQEERHALGHQLLDAEPMPALGGVAGGQMVLELGDQEDGVRVVGGFLGDEERHGEDITSCPLIGLAHQELATGHRLFLENPNFGACTGWCWACRSVLLKFNGGRS